MKEEVPVEFEGRSLRLSRLDKPLYPSGFTKAQVIDYYRRAAPSLLPHLKDRPLTLKRYPEGSMAEFFYEKNCPAHRPRWFKTAPVWSRHRGATINYCLVDDTASLVWVANLASLELHTSLSRAARIGEPTMVVFDLDPGAPAELLDCARVALRLRDVLSGLGLQSFAKTSGKKGIQVYVPLNTPTSYDETKPFAHAVAMLLEQEDPARITSLMKTELRRGKVFIDWSQNDEHKTTVCVYSLRAEPRPTVSTPVTWDEVAGVAEDGRREALVFEAPEVLRRIERHGDLFSPVLTLRQRLQPAAQRSWRRPEGERLREYGRRRHFEVTPEPAPAEVAARPGEPPRFMVHKHHAHRLHYDLRLEIDGALASWAVPKGPSVDPADKRLAVETEDHPAEYGEFEGRIPDGEYGAGDSLIWDRGTWQSVPPGEEAEQRRRGRMSIELHGEKLRGRWHLVRTGRRDSSGAGKTQWLLFKAKDEEANPGFDIVAARPESVRSGRVLTRGPESARTLRAIHPPPERLLETVFPPMLATLVKAFPPDDEHWTYEIKYDGFRCLAARSGDRVAMWSRNRLDLAGRFPRVARAIGELVIGEAVLDGEVVALDAEGRPRFEALQRGEPEVMVCFDLLWLDGEDLRARPLEERRDLLESVLGNAPEVLRRAERLPGPGRAAVEMAAARSLEGLVGKRRGSKYEGRRSASWLKLKLANSQEAAIVGYTTIEGASDQIGALLVAVRERGVLTYAGKVGTGFSTAQRKDLLRLLRDDAVDAPAFARATRMKRAVFVRPRHVAEVRFAEWTADGLLRQPSYQGLRPDKSVDEVVRDRP